MSVSSLPKAVTWKRTGIRTHRLLDRERTLFRYATQATIIHIALKKLMPQSRCPGKQEAGVVSNISQCQIALICAIARARSRKVSSATVYLIFISLLTLCLGS